MSVFFRIFSILVFLQFFNSAPLFAKPQCGPKLENIKVENATYGGEWTFTNSSLIKAGFKDVEAYASEENRKAQREWAESLTGRADLVVEKFFVRKIKGEDKIFDYRVTDRKTGWWYVVSLDPGVLEIKTKPSTSEVFENMKGYIEEEIFMRAKNFGLKPHKKHGGGHIHIGIQHFKTYLHFRNFLVDLYNNEYIFPYIFGEGPSSFAGPISLMPKSFQQRLKSVIDEVDRMDGVGIDKIILLCKKIKNEVYTDNLGFGGGSFEEISKYQAINVNHVAEDQFAYTDKTIEIRPFRAQRSIHEFLMQIKLLEGRREYVESFNNLIEYNMFNGKPWDYKVVSAYREYVEQSKQSWDDYKKLMPAKYKTLP